MGSEHLKLLVANEFPFPIAYAFRRSMDESESRELACAVFQGLLELTGMVLTADYLASDERTPSLDVEARRLFQSPPSCGVWRDWIYRMLEEHAQRGTLPFIPSLSGLLEREARKELTKLLEWRNRCFHGGAAFEVGDFRRLLTSLFGKVHSIHKATIFCPNSSRLSGPLHFIQSTLLKGESPVLPEVECRSEIPLETGHVHIHAADSGEVLSLHPLILYERCDACSGRHVFHFNRVTSKKVVYTSIPQGHEKSSTEAFATIEQMLLRRRAKKVRPRHFWMPGGLGMMRTLHEGDSIGPYTVAELIRLGGLSQIYRAIEKATGSTYAIKLLPIELSRDPLILMRFEEEVHNLRKLRHPNVVKVHAVGEDFGDRYMVLDLAPGGVIEGRRCRDLSELEKPISEEAVVRIGLQLCDGLQYIHEHGIVHRDLKPGNILVAGHRVLIADFGISRARGDPALTLTGMPVGTPEYMSPEQINEGETDHRTDIYSLGCVLYELATGRPPYQAETPLTTALQHLQARPSRPSELNDRISGGLSNIILKALQKAPHLRQGSAKELHHELSTAAKDPAGPQVIEGDAVPQHLAEEMRLRERRRYRRRLATVLSIASALLLGLSAWLAIATLGADYRVRSLVTGARAAWAASPPRWEEALGGLQEARTRDSRHPAVLNLLGDMFAGGSLLVASTSPPDLAIEVTPDPDSGRGLGLSGLWSPRVLSPKSRFSAGERIPLAIGHYRLSFMEDGLRLPLTGVIFIGHRHYLPRGEVWSSTRVPHPASATLDPRSDGVRGFYVADSMEIPRLTVPTASIEGFSWVHEGIAWVSPDPSELSQRREQESIALPRERGQLTVSRYDGTPSLKPIEVVRPYFIARDETTTGAFRAWFERFGGAFSRHRQELDSNLWRVLLDTRRVPMEVQRSTWRSTLESRGISAESLEDPEALVDAVFAEHLELQRKRWEDFEEAMRKDLEGEQDDGVPIGGVFRDLAQTYARTHVRIEPDVFRPWLRRRIERSRARIEGWTRLGGAIARIPPGDLDPAALPGDLLFTCNWVCPDGKTRENVLQAYSRGLRYGTYYAGQIPAAALERWAERTGSGLGIAPDRLRQVLDEIKNPSLWLWRMERGEGEPPIRIRREGREFYPLLAAYADALLQGTAPIDRAHLLSWLDDQVRDESDRMAFHEDILVRTAGDLDATLDAILRPLPADRRAARLSTRVFLLLIEYGEAQGWSLPTHIQWERSCRGPDARAYPWGDAALGYACWTSRMDGAKPLAVTAARLYGRDVSPFGVYALAGNQSEWILCPETSEGPQAFLKGAHSYSNVFYANAGYFFSMEGGYSMPWTGFRVVRELRLETEED